MRTLVFLIIIISTKINAGHIDTLFVYSSSMQKEIPNLVITPENYNLDSVQYPVLYLLHGAGGNYSSWISNVPELSRYVDQYNFIIVCPDGGKTSWYIDSPVDHTMKYETYISRELVTHIDSLYKTIKVKSGRGITGLSMGGFGALYLAIKNQDIFGVVGSTSGGVDFRKFPNNWDLKKRLGDPVAYKQNWDNYTIINLIDSLKPDQFKIMIDCGTEDFFLESNQRLSNKLNDLKIPFTYLETEGGHNWNYWKVSIESQLRFFFESFNLADN